MSDDSAIARPDEEAGNEEVRADNEPLEADNGVTARQDTKPGGQPHWDSEPPFKEDDRETLTAPPPESGQARPSPSDDTGSFLSSVDENEAMAQPRPFVGMQLANFQVTSVLGEGGFGKVFKACDKTLEREVAIKFLHDPLDVKRKILFEREGKALAALSKHPHIVEIYQWGEYGHQHYFVLEFVASNAAKLIEEYPDGLPVNRALKIAAECAEALAEAHKNGILHRDIKPANILIESNGLSKLADFGLARLREASSEFTVEGGISGSPPYMSPEQATGGKLDARSDIFSLGATLYEMLSAKPAFEGDSALQVMNRIRENQGIPLRSRRPDLPEGILVLVDKAMAHAPENRYQSAGDLARDLRIALRSLERAGRVEVPAVDPVPKPRRPMPMKKIVVVGGMALAVAVVLGVLILVPGQGSGPPTGRGEADNGPVEETLSEAPVTLPDDTEKTAAVAPPPPRKNLPAVTELTTAPVTPEACMDTGDYAQAVKLYAKQLDADPANENALYGYAMALAQSGKPKEAGRAFGRLKDPNRKAEGVALLAFESDGVKARDTVEQVQTDAPYAAVVLGKIDLLEEENMRVIDSLGSLAKEELTFDWQYAEAQHTLGQAYYRLEEYAKAKEIFEKFQKQSDRPRDRMAQAYLAAIEQKIDVDKQAAVSAKAKEIRDLIERSGGTEEERDLWTSRPLTFFVLPVETRDNPFAADSGLADLLPMLLGEELSSGTPMTLVNRDIINEVLAEQELSTLVGSKNGQITLGRVMGARLIIQCDFASLFDRDKLTIKMIDVETTVEPPIRSIDIAEVESEYLLDQLAEDIWEAARTSYPLQARLFSDKNGATINIGATVGVEPGMVFEVLLDKEASTIQGASVRVKEMPGSHVSEVEVVGLDLAKLGRTPETGCYVRERGTTS